GYVSPEGQALYDDWQARQHAESARVTCPTCGGEKLIVTGWDADVYENIESACPTCKGTGTVDAPPKRVTTITVEKWRTIAKDVAAGRCQVIEPESNEIVVDCSLGYGPDSYVGYIVTKSGTHLVVNPYWSLKIEWLDAPPVNEPAGERRQS